MDEEDHERGVVDDRHSLVSHGPVQGAEKDEEDNADDFKLF